MNPSLGLLEVDNFVWSINGIDVQTNSRLNIPSFQTLGLASSSTLTINPLRITDSGSRNNSIVYKFLIGQFKIIYAWILSESTKCALRDI